MKKTESILPLLISSALLSSCSTSYYHKGEFFPNDFLKEHLIENLPIPEGDILYREQVFLNSPCVYVNSNIDAEVYAQQVLDYLKSQNFKFIYTVDSVYASIGIVPMEDSYKVKEFTTFDECYYSDTDSWFFIFGNNEETYTDDEGIIFLQDEHMVRIHNEPGTVRYDKESIYFDYDWKVIINDDPCNVTYSGY